MILYQIWLKLPWDANVNVLSVMIIKFYLLVQENKIQVYCILGV